MVHVRKNDYDQIGDEAEPFTCPVTIWSRRNESKLAQFLSSEYWFSPLRSQDFKIVCCRVQSINPETSGRKLNTNDSRWSFVMLSEVQPEAPSFPACTPFLQYYTYSEVCQFYPSLSSIIVGLIVESAIKGTVDGLVFEYQGSIERFDLDHLLKPLHFP